MEREDLIERSAEFLNEFYKDEILKAVNEGKKSVEVDFSLLDKFDVELADYLLENPEETISATEEAIKQIDTGLSEAKIRLRFYNLPDNRNIRIRNIRSEHIGKLIVVDGIVKRASEVRPEVSEAIFQCPECGRNISIIQTERLVRPPVECECGNRKGFKLVNQKLYDARWIMVEEPYEIVSGERPSEIMIYLKEDLTSPKMQNKTDPGNRIRVVGILKEIPRRVKGSRSRQMDIFIDANHVESVETVWEELEITPEDEKRIVEAAKDPEVFNKLIASIAPSMYGLEDVKEAIILQLFGADPKVLKDKTRIRGNIHILLVGDPSSGKCVSGNTYVTLQDGSITKIKDVVEKVLKKEKKLIDDGYFAITNHDTFSMGLNCRIIPSIANIVWKRQAPPYLYRVLTQTGSSIITSPTHLFFTLSDNGITAKRAEELTLDDYVCVVGKIPSFGNMDKLTVKIKRRKRAKGVKLPTKITPEFCRFLGYVISESYIQERKNSGCIYFTNTDKELIKDFKLCCKKLFGISPKERKPHKGKNAFDVYFSSIEVIDFLKELDGSLLKPSRYKRIPQAVLRASKNNLANLLRALFDGEGEVSSYSRSISFTSASKELINQVRLLLLRFGILSQAHSRRIRVNGRLKSYYRLTISGANVLKYKNEIGFTSKKKLEKLRKNLDRKLATNIYLIPNITSKLVSLRKRLRLTQFDLGLPRSTYEHLEKDRKPKPITLEKVVKRLEERLEEVKRILESLDTTTYVNLKGIRKAIRISQQEIAERLKISQTTVSLYEQNKMKLSRNSSRETFSRIINCLKDVCKEMLGSEKDILFLKVLSNSDVIWEKVLKIERIKSKSKWVYDLQVLPYHNFVANNFIVHNSQLMQLVSKLVPRGKYVSGSGVTAAGICTVYDTLVQFEDGTLKKIGEVVEEEFSKGFEKVEEGVYRTIAREERKIISFNPETLKFEPRKVTHYWRIKAPSRLVKIKTRMGKEIITTLETPIPTIKDGKMRWVKAKDVRPSSFIVSPRIINVRPTTESLYSKIDRNAHILNAKTFVPKLIESIKERSTIREFCKDCGLNENDLYYSWKRKGSPTVLEIEKIARWLGIAPEEVLPAKLSLSQYNGHRITLPLYPTEGLMYVMGLLAGDGSISRTNFGGFDIKLFNIHNQILKDFCLLCNEVLDVQPPYSKDRNGVPYYRFHSKIFGNLLDKFGVPSGGKSHNIRISETLSKLPNNLLAYYLRGIFDTDGSCMEGKGKRGSRIEFSSASKEFVEGLQILLHRFRIISKIREKRPHESFIQGRKVKSGRNYVLEISGRENLEAFKRYIGFGLLEKAEKLERIIKSSSTHTNIDIIPEIGCLLRRLREELKLSAKEFYGYKCYHYEKGRRNPTRKFIARIIQKFGRIKTNTLEELKKILDSEVFWDKVVEVEIFDNKKYRYVYDLTVEGEHSFVANGLVIHNTATVVRDEEFLGGWVLEAGALVMANKSICCLHPSSNIIFENKVLPISKLFNEKKSEKILCNGEIMEICKLNGIVPSFDFNYLSSSQRKATLIRRKKYSGKILKIKLDSGFEIRLTPEHLLIDGNTLKWKKAGDFREGEYVLAPLKLQNKERPILIFDLIPDNWKVCLNKNEKEEIKSEILRKYKSVAEFNRKLSLRREILSGGCQPTLKQFKKIIKDLGVIEKWKTRPLKYGRTRLKTAWVTPELGYVLGFVLGDGYFNRSKHHRGVRITQSVKHPEIIKKFVENWNKVFPKLHEYEDSRESNIRGRKVKSTSKVFYYGSNLFVLLYDKLVGRSLEKVLSLPEEVLKSFIAGVFDSDGCISIKRSKKGGKEYKVAHVEFLIGKDLRTNLNFILALRKLDVYSKLIPTDKKVDIIRITGRRDVSLLRDLISKYSVKINVEIPERIHDVSSCSDKLPSFVVAEICRRIVESVNTSLLNEYSLKMIYPYKNLKYQPSREELKKIAVKLDKKINPEIRGEIVKLLQRDFFLDKIVEVKEEDYEGFVFDLFVPGTNNFVADGIFVHNCIDEFSKVSPQDRVALMEAMSLETISIAKASIVATLPAQTAILAGGNPKLGRFDPYIPIREQVDIDDVLLSVDWSEPILIKENGLVRTETIGSFVDKYCSSNNLVDLNGNVEVPALNLKTLKIEWWPIKYVFRHKINKPLIKLLLETGREIKVTKGHSVYVFENGEIKTKRTDEIKVGDFVLIPRRLPNNEKIIKEINLVEELLKIPESYTSTIYLHNVPKDSFIRLNIKNRNWINKAILPLKFANKLNKEEIRHCYLKYKGGVPSKVPTIIPVNKDLMRLLGYYIAEGSMLITKTKEHLISFSLNRKEENVIEDLKNIVKKLFNHDVTYVKGRNEIKVNIANKIVYLLFSEILKVKKLAENKEVPSLVFNVSKELQKEFLKAYHLGDYGVTVSKNLASDLLYLFLQNNIISSVSYTKPHEQIFPDGHISKTKTSYAIADAVKRFRNFESAKWFSWLPLETIKDFLRSIFQSKYKGYGENKKHRFLTKNWWNKVFWRKTRVKLLERMNLLKNSYTADEFTRLVYPKNKLKNFRTKREWIRAYLNKMVKRGLVEKEKIGGVFRYSLSERGKEILRKIDTIQKIFSSDIAFVKVKKIEEASPTNEYVYDVSTPGHENFVAGFGGVICHNSRFDLKFALRDLPNPELDSKIAEHILRMRQYEEEAKPLFEPEFIRKWIAYARARVHPTLTPEAGNRLKEFYLEMRLKAGEEAPVAITLRQYEALLRLAEASARVRLSDKVELEDAERAIRLMKVSLRQFGFEPETGTIDIDRAEGARVTSAQRSKIRIVLDVIEDLSKTFGKEIPTDEIIKRAKEQNVSDAEDILRKMQYEGIVYSPRTGFISKV